jgi:hypothetical protein
VYECDYHWYLRHFVVVRTGAALPVSVSVSVSVSLTVSDCASVATVTALDVIAIVEVADLSPHEMYPESSHTLLDDL